MYWGRIKREPKGAVRPRRPPSINKMWKLAYENEPFAVEVIEVHYAYPFAEPELEILETHELTRQKLIDGVEKWVTFMHSRGRYGFMFMRDRMLDPDDWDLDAGDADAIVQFALFGELTFG